MTDVEVDFYYIDKDGDIYYIDSANIDYIEGDGNSSTAIVDWKADMLARQIKVVADPDGSDGGPSEGYQDINVTQADYAQKLYCPYPTGSGEAGDTLDFWVKVDNIGGEDDDACVGLFRHDGGDEIQSASIWEMDVQHEQAEVVDAQEQLCFEARLGSDNAIAREGLLDHSPGGNRSHHTIFED